MTGEVYAFMGAVYGGMVIGLVYCVFHFFNCLVKRRFAHAALDALFYIAASAVAALTLMAVSRGELRIYLVAGLILGAIASARAVLGLLRLIKPKKSLR